jgi:hypothetical protein
MSIKDLSTKEIRELVKDIYIFSYPVLIHYYTMYKNALNPSSIEFSGGFGKFLQFGLVKPGETDIVAPNNDTPYSLSWADARNEPWVLILPKVESDRYCSCQVNDLWGFVVDNAGSIKDGNDGGAYLLTTRLWQGELPKGVRRAIKTESPWIFCNIRTQLYEEADFPRVR